MSNLQAAEFLVQRWGAAPSIWSHFSNTLGLTADLLPVVANPDAPISERSKMKDKGKTPSLKNRDGKVVGIPEWTQHQASEAQVGRWARDPDLGICVQTRRLRALDVDVVDVAQAKAVRAAIEAYLMAEGLCEEPALRMRGNSPKFLVPFWLEGSFPKRVIRTAHGAIEFLGNGQQFVAMSTHPSGVRYEWAGTVETIDEVALPSGDAIPTLSPAQFEGLWAHLQAEFGTSPAQEMRVGGAQPTRPRSLADANDPLLEYLERKGWVVDYQTDGRVNVRCPWEDGHSVDSGPTSTTFFPAGVGGFEQGHFKCLHASCAHRTDGDFREAVGWAAEGLPLVLTQAEFDEMELCDGLPEGVEVQIVAETVDSSQEVQMRNAARARPSETDADARVDRTDAGNMNLLAQLSAGDLRYVPQRRVWLLWDGLRWAVDEHGVAAQRAALRVAEHYHLQAAALFKQAKADGLESKERKHLQQAAELVEKWATHCRNRRAIDAMLALARSDERFVLSVEALDRDPWLFGVANGVVDLRTGELRAAARDDYVTRSAPVAFDPTACAPRWLQFIDEITSEPAAAGPSAMKRRPALVSYLHRALGYAMTGSTGEHKMFIAIGEGSNGKNVLLDLLQWLMDAYCETIPPESLMATRFDADAERPSSVAAKLAGARLAIGSESKDGARLDVALVKRHTGGGFMTARFLRENAFTFEISHKLWLMTNHRPALDHLDDAMRGRLHLIPFDMRWNRPGHPDRDPRLPDGDKDLPAKLRAEARGVLAWLVRGAVAYNREGLEPPAEVVRMTRAFFNEQDPLGRWLETLERCEPNSGTGAARLFEAFSRWREDEGESGGPQSQRSFSTELIKRGVQKQRDEGARRYGLRIPADVETFA